MGIVAFLPIKGTSGRVPGKNHRPFAGMEGGLSAIKMRQLQQVPGLEAILVSIPRSDPLGMEAFDAVRQGWMPEMEVPVTLLEEPDHGKGTNGMIAWVTEVTAKRPDTDIVLFTHVTSPFFDETWYAKALSAYRTRVGHGHDSLMTCTAIQDFIWGLNGPINWNRKREQWPRTQDLLPFRILHSAAFMAPLSVYRKLGDRIGNDPFLFVTPRLPAIEIDWPEDWELAEALWSARSAARHGLPIQRSQPAATEHAAPPSARDPGDRHHYG